MSLLKVYYEKEVIPKLIEKFKYANIMQVPKLGKIVLNMGLGEAINNINDSDLTEIVTTDSIRNRQLSLGEIPILRQVTIAPLLARAIVNIHNEQSVSSLLEDDWDNFNNFD